MAAERALEPFVEEVRLAQPNLHLVPALPEDDKHKQVVERQVSVERTSVGDVHVNVIVEVDGREYPLCINVSRRTLGNGMPVSTYFERLEHRRQNEDGTISGDFGRADALAQHGVYAAGR